jgi:hypothetical protein
VEIAAQPRHDPVLKLLGESRQTLHQPALAASSIIFVDNALFRGSVELADRLDHCGLGDFRVLGFNRSASLSHESAGTPTINTVTNAAILILPISLDLRLDISQSRSSKKCPQVQARILHERHGFVQDSERPQSNGKRGRMVIIPNTGKNCHTGDKPKTFEGAGIIPVTQAARPSFLINPHDLKG